MEKKPNNIDYLVCRSCGGTGYVKDSSAGLKPGVYKMRCPMCAAHFTVHVGESRFEGHVEGMSSEEVSSVVRSIIGSPPGPSIMVTESMIGVLNTGQIQEVEDIVMNLKTLNSPGTEEVARAIEELTRAVAQNTNLISEIRNECLGLLHELNEQAALPTDKRSHIYVIRSVLSGLACTLSASDGLAESWSMWGPAIKTYFGL